MTTRRRFGRQPGGFRYSPAFFGIAVGNFLVLLDAAILNVALPDVRHDLGAPLATLPWVANAYTVVFAGLLLASGAVADRLGARLVYRVSLAAFAVLSLACAAAGDVGMLITGRALLGVAAAGLVPASLALLAAEYPDRGLRARAIGAWAAVVSSGLIVGPILGGLLVTAAGWRAIFLVNPPIAVLALLGAGRRATAGPQAEPRQPEPRQPEPGCQPEPRRPHPLAGLDLPGLALSMLGLGLLSLGLIDGGTSGWRRPLPVVTVLVALALLAALVAVERRVADPVLPPSLLGLGRIRSDLITGAGASLVFYGVLFLLSQWLQEVRGFSPLRTGLSFLPMTLPMCILPFFAGRIVARFGARPLMIFGLSLDLLAGLLLLPAGRHGSFGWIVAAQVAMVLASTTAIPAATADVSTSAPTPLAATAQGAMNAGRQTGAALGVALIGTLHTLHSAGLLLAGVALLCLALVSLT